LKTYAIILGTRPEAIKLAPVMLAMLARPKQFRPMLWVSGQHKELMHQALQIFDLWPDVDLELMQENQSQANLIGSILQRIGSLIVKNKPDGIVVQGDTSTALAGALGGFFAGVPVIHVEAGLRTYDLSAPFPEEGNRQMISRITRLHCAPTQRAYKQLLSEQIPPAHVVLTGNTVVDAIRWVAARNHSLPLLPFPVQGQRLVLTTLHRRESFGATLEGMLHAIRQLADRSELGLVFIFPMHPNPNVRQQVELILGGHPRIALLEPLNYIELAGVLAHCWLVLTDSGGLQEEAPSLAKPVLVLRDVTERPEGIETGAAELVGTEPSRLISAVERLHAEPNRYRRMTEAANPYGNGLAAEAILNAIEHLDPR